MFIFRPVHLRRIRQIVGVFYHLGFGTWIRAMKMRHLIPLRTRLSRAAHENDLPKNLRLALEQLGGGFVKLGQMLSIRADLIGLETAQELRHLQDEVAPFPSVAAAAAIERELQAPLTKFFRKFDPAPAGSASLAQVHRAVLKNGEMVAVKILRPGIEELVKEDILLLRWLATQIEKHLPAARPFQPIKIIEEFAEWTLRELNLANEATNIGHFRALFANEPAVYIPAVHWNLTTRRLLTTEFSHGIPIDDFSRYRAIKCSRTAVAKLGTEIVFRQFFEFGFFHGDPHPGNFFLKPKNVICLHDFGIVGHLETPIRRELISCLVNFLEHNEEGVVKHLLHLAKTNEAADVNGFKQDVSAILDKWFYSPTVGERISTAFYKTVIVGASRGVIFPPNILLFAKAVMTMESTALLLDPKFDIGKALQPYLQRIMAIEFKPEKLLQQGREILLDSANFFEELPEAARTLIKLARQEQFGVKLDTSEFSAIKKEIDRQADIRILSLILVADLLATAVLLHLEGVQKIIGVPLGFAGVIIAAALSFIVLMKLRKNAE
ncbi:MAG: ABC1 protein [Candidatus Magasanikbacteria bacterium]|nr:ABC1 protein [Candidatus Magasanikbacteria bacterium]